MLEKIVKKTLNSRLFFNFLLKEQHFLSSHIYYANVDPEQISHISLVSEGSCKISGPEAAYGVYKGYFDLVKMPFKKHYMYQTVEQVIDGKKHDSTPYFKKLAKNGGKRKAIAQLKKIEKLIKILSNKGYRSQYELGNSDKTLRICNWDVPLHETMIGMGRDGTLFRIKGGRHRLAVAQLINIPEIPVILTLYHKDAINMLPDKKRIITGNPDDFRLF